MGVLLGKSHRLLRWARGRCATTLAGCIPRSARPRQWPIGRPAGQLISRATPPCGIGRLPQRRLLPRRRRKTLY